MQKIPEELINELAPYLSGLSTFLISVLIYHLTSDTLEDFSEFINEESSYKLKVIYNINKDVINAYLS